LMKDIIWTLREAGSTTSVGRFDDSVTLHDPSLSPDWLVMPHDENVPSDVRGRRVRVRGSVWLDFAPNPEPNAEQFYLQQVTRWHLIEESKEVAIAEVVGHGWVVVCLTEEMYIAFLKEVVTQLEMGVNPGACDA